MKGQPKGHTRNRNAKKDSLNYHDFFAKNNSKKGSFDDHESGKIESSTKFDPNHLRKKNKTICHWQSGTT